ncbi:MAG TPA: hypothetical protein PK264_06025 [Hyphomicrobiaceae bacterium]|nr:hypothetical protein [Hyphomicrobiaceae bacterium]
MHSNDPRDVHDIWRQGLIERLDSIERNAALPPPAPLAARAAPAGRLAFPTPPADASFERILEETLRIVENAPMLPPAATPVVGQREAGYRDARHAQAALPPPAHRPVATDAAHRPVPGNSLPRPVDRELATIPAPAPMLAEPLPRGILPTQPATHSEVHRPSADPIEAALDAVTTQLFGIKPPPKAGLQIGRVPNATAAPSFDADERLALRGQGTSFDELHSAIASARGAEAVPASRRGGRLWAFAGVGAAVAFGGLAYLVQVGGPLDTLAGTSSNKPVAKSTVAKAAAPERTGVDGDRAAHHWQVIAEERPHAVFFDPDHAHASSDHGRVRIGFELHVRAEDRRAAPIPLDLKWHDGIEPRAVSILISNLPAGVTLSHGKPTQTGAWIVASSDLGALRVSLPDDVKHLELTVDAIDEHGTRLARARALLKTVEMVAAAPVQPPTSSGAKRKPSKTADAVVPPAADVTDATPPLTIATKGGAQPKSDVSAVPVPIMSSARVHEPRPIAKDGAAPTLPPAAAPAPSVAAAPVSPKAVAKAPRPAGASALGGPMESEASSPVAPGQPAAPLPAAPTSLGSFLPPPPPVSTAPVWVPRPDH